MLALDHFLNLLPPVVHILISRFAPALESEFGLQVISSLFHFTVFHALLTARSQVIYPNNCHDPLDLPFSLRQLANACVKGKRNENNREA